MTARRPAPGRRIARRIAAAVVAAGLAAGPAGAASLPPAGATTCSGCHGAGGAVPPLKGVAAVDMSAAMRAFRTGARPATVMDRIAKGFSDEEIEAVAAWIAAQP